MKLLLHFLAFFYYKQFKKKNLNAFKILSLSWVFSSLNIICLCMALFCFYPVHSSQWFFQLHFFCLLLILETFLDIVSNIPLFSFSLHFLKNSKFMYLKVFDIDTQHLNAVLSYCISILVNSLKLYSSSLIHCSIVSSLTACKLKTLFILICFSLFLVFPFVFSYSFYWLKLPMWSCMLSNFY